MSNEESQEDKFASMTAAVDQMSAHMRQIAEFVTNYREELRSNGCPDDLADSLTQSLHERTLSLIFPSSNPFSGLFGHG